MAPRALPGWLPWLFVALLVAPFDPYWIDFENARRAQLLALSGLAITLWPRVMARYAPGSGALLVLTGWTCLAAIFTPSTTIWPQALLAIAQWLALLALLQLGGGADASCWRRAFGAALIATSLFGLLQRLGLADFYGYGQVSEPVSVFGNLNVAAEFTAIAGGAAAVAFARAPRTMALALVCAGAYALVNGSRSALVALPLAAGWVTLWPGQRLLHRVAPLGCVLTGLILGLAIESAGPTRIDPIRLLASNRTATLEVRMHITDSGLSMIGQAPVLGSGPGQFAVQYPRFRSPEEIEISSQGRQEYRSVETAHNDWLQTAIEGGVPALLLLLWFFFAQWRAAENRRFELAPLVALAALMLIRSPLANAPAAAAALLTLGSTLPAATNRIVWPWRLAGLGAGALGIWLLLAQGQLADYLRERGEAPLGNPTTLEQSLQRWPFDVAALQLLTQEQQARANDAAAAGQALATCDQLVALRPNEPSFQLLRADLLRLCGRTEDAKEAIKRAAALDPGDPQIWLQLAGVYFTERDAEAVIRTLYADPPPVLREALADRFDEYAGLAEQLGDGKVQQLFAAEAAFLRALQAMGSKDPLRQALAQSHLKRCIQAFAKAGIAGDVRERILAALLALDLGDEQLAEQAADIVAASGRQLPDWQRSFLEPYLGRLRALPAWARLLPVETEAR
ncbi:MAG: O-antigen ligase family protein [Planctomycetota bacterium]|nr:O-antigen ligase family protein [Planctomycetota bacterium]